MRPGNTKRCANNVSMRFKAIKPNIEVLPILLYVILHIHIRNAMNILLSLLLFLCVYIRVARYFWARAFFWSRLRRITFTARYNQIFDDLYCKVVFHFTSNRRNNILYGCFMKRWFVLNINYADKILGFDLGGRAAVTSTSQYFTKALISQINE